MLGRGKRARLRVMFRIPVAHRKQYCVHAISFPAAKMRADCTFSRAVQRPKIFTRQRTSARDAYMSFGTPSTTRTIAFPRESHCCRRFRKGRQTDLMMDRSSRRRSPFVRKAVVANLQAIPSGDVARPLSQIRNKLYEVFFTAKSVAVVASMYNANHQRQEQDSDHNINSCNNSNDNNRQATTSKSNK